MYLKFVYFHCFFAVNLFSHVYLLQFGSDDNTFHRRVTSSYICGNEGVDVIYTLAKGDRDAMHYYSSANGIPTLLMLRTNTKSDCTFNCTSFLAKQSNDVIDCGAHVVYSYALSFTKLYEYNDKDDSANLPENADKDIKAFDMSQLSFSNITATSDLKTNSFTWTVTNSSELIFKEKGSLSFGIEIYGEDGRNDQLPHLLYDANSSHVFITLDNIKPSYESSRFAIEIERVTLNEDKRSEKTAINTKKSLDDEHTPGVFDTLEWTTKDDADAKGSYLQWKPVCYLSQKASIQQSTTVKDYEVKERSMSEFSLAQVYFGAEFNVSATNVSFGLTKDKFYNSALYTKWTFSSGYGSPPEDRISGLIITIISVGLGIPVLLIIIGGICACVRKRSVTSPHESSGYTAIQ